MLELSIFLSYIANHYIFAKAPSNPLLSLPFQSMSVVIKKKSGSDALARFNRIRFIVLEYQKNNNYSDTVYEALQ